MGHDGARQGRLSGERPGRGGFGDPGTRVLRLVRRSSVIKTGIWRLEQLERGWDRTPFRKSLRQVSITLYRLLQDHPKADELAERILLQFGDERGTYKRTYSSRFGCFDVDVTEQIKAAFDVNLPVRIHDVGASDGRTSCDLFDSLKTSFPHLSFFASDTSPEVEVIRSGRTHIVLGRENRVLEITWPPFVFNESKRDSYRHYPLNHVARLVLKHSVVRRALAARAKGEIRPDHLALWCPRALAYAASDSRFRVGQYDVLTATGQEASFEVIRTMNVLNPSYFSTAELQIAFRHMLASLVQGGLLVIGSNEGPGSPVNGSILRKAGERAELLLKRGTGTAVDPFIRSILVYG
jgi:hypothetical protein